MNKKLVLNPNNEYYNDVVQNCLNSYRNLGCNMSIKVHFLFSQIENFPKNLGDVSDEQDIKILEEGYQGRWGKTMMADFCWCLQRKLPMFSTRGRSTKEKCYPKEFFN